MAELARFKRHEFGIVVRRALMLDGRGQRAIAPLIGVTSTDLRRVTTAQPVAYEKVRAIAAWVGIDPGEFYVPPEPVPNDFKLLQCASRETGRGKGRQAS